MASISDESGKNYVLGRGKVLFDRFASDATIDSSTKGDGFRYLGNTPSFSTTSATENLDHFDADGGVKTKDDAVQLSLNRSGKTETDNVSIENVALSMLGESLTADQDADPAVVEEFVVKKGLWYQLGVSESNPTGNRLGTLTTVKNGVAFADTVDNDPNPNFQFDDDLCMIYIEPNAADIDDGDTIQVTYSIAASSRPQIVSGTTSIYGQLKFIADNPKGANRDYYFPYVKMAPDGDYNLKGDDWQKMGFTFEILKRGSLEACYIDGRAVADA